MVQKIFNRVFVDYDEGVIFIAFQIFGGEWNVDRILPSTGYLIRLANKEETGEPIAVTKICV